jgi:hypothetical protein
MKVRVASEQKKLLEAIVTNNMSSPEAAAKFRLFMKDIKTQFSNPLTSLSKRTPTPAPTSAAEHAVSLQHQRIKIETLQSKHRVVRDAILRILEPMHAAPSPQPTPNSSRLVTVSRSRIHISTNNTRSHSSGVTMHPTPHATFVPYLQRVFTPFPTPPTTQPSLSPTGKPTASPSFPLTKSPSITRPTFQPSAFPTRKPTPQATFKPFAEGNNDRDWINKQIKQLKQASNVLGSRSYNRISKRSKAAKDIFVPTPAKSPTQEPTTMLTMKPHVLVKI